MELAYNNNNNNNNNNSSRVFVLLMSNIGMEVFKYLGTTLTIQNFIQEKIKSRFIQGMFAIMRCRILCLSVCYPEI